MATVFLFLAPWGIACRFLSSEWSINEQYNYGWFVPFFAAYLFWRWQDRPPVAAPLRGASTAHRAVATSQKAESGKFIAVSLSLVVLLLLVPIPLFEVANPDWRSLGWLHVVIVARPPLQQSRRPKGVIDAWLLGQVQFARIREITGNESIDSNFHNY